MSPAPALAPATAPRCAPRHAPATAPASRPRRSHLRLVEPTPAPRTRVAPAPREGLSRPVAALLGAGVLFAVLFAVAVLQTQNVAGQMHLDRMQQDISDRRAQAQSMRLEAAALASPERIVSEAERLGLVEPAGGPTYVSLVPAPAAPAGDPTTPADPSVLAAPEAEVSLDETAAGAVDTVPMP